MHRVLLDANRIASSYVIDAGRARSDATILSMIGDDALRGMGHARGHGIAQSHTDLDTGLADPELDMVYISTTNERYHDWAPADIAAGKHLLCDSSFATSRADATDMVTAADGAGVAFATNHHLRSAGGHHAMRDSIRSDRTGHVHKMRASHAVGLPEQLCGQRINDVGAGGGVIPGITAHDVDTVRAPLVKDPVDVVAKRTTPDPGGGVENSEVAARAMPLGATARSSESYTYRHARAGIQIRGTKGSIDANRVLTQDPTGSICLTDADGNHDIAFDKHPLYNRALRLLLDTTSGLGRPPAGGTDSMNFLAVAVRGAGRTGVAPSANPERSEWS